MEDEKTIQDLRVTKKKKEDRVEREVQRLPLRSEEPKGDKVECRDSMSCTPAHNTEV